MAGLVARLQWLLLMWTLGVGSACVADWDLGEKGSGSDSADPNTDDTGCNEPEGDSGEWFEPADARITAVAGGLDFSANNGHYTTMDCGTLFHAVQVLGDATTREMELILEGTTDYAGAYTVVSFSLVERIEEADNTYEFEADIPLEATFDVAGFGPDEAVHGSFSNAAMLADLLNGGSVELSSFVVEAWPKM